MRIVFALLTVCALSLSFGFTAQAAGKADLVNSLDGR